MDDLRLSVGQIGRVYGATEFCPLRASTCTWIGTQCFPQQKVLENEASIPTRKRRSTNAAGYLGINGFGPSFSFDQVVKRVATRAVEMRGRGPNHDSWSPHKLSSYTPFPRVQLPEGNVIHVYSSSSLAIFGCNAASKMY